jgi:hypothetical protein
MNYHLKYIKKLPACKDLTNPSVNLDKCISTHILCIFSYLTTYYIKIGYTNYLTYCLRVYYGFLHVVNYTFLYILPKQLKLLFLELNKDIKIFEVL